MKPPLPSPSPRRQSPRRSASPRRPGSPKRKHNPDEEIGSESLRPTKRTATAESKTPLEEVRPVKVILPEIGADWRS
jgi:hypothetical protein